MDQTHQHQMVLLTIFLWKRMTICPIFIAKNMKNIIISKLKLLWIVNFIFQVQYSWWNRFKCFNKLWSRSRMRKSKWFVSQPSKITDWYKSYNMSHICELWALVLFKCATREPFFSSVVWTTEVSEIIMTKSTFAMSMRISKYNILLSLIKKVKKSLSEVFAPVFYLVFRHLFALFFVMLLITVYL